ncbi:MmgE/PrpD family protein [Caenimonas terrae]|uniref:MmgE/PrpD family protein n=1 Tax=Caenimonas terrae TaxID=696074 RepID=A0ABW0NGB4_9BURK
MSRQAPPPVAWHRWAGHVDALRSAVAARHNKHASARVSQHARLVLMDSIGCLLAGRRAPEVAALEAQLGALEPGDFPMPGGRSLGLRAACQLLAIAPTWYEACEGHAYAHGRPGIAAIAALLPLALQRDARVGDFVDALVTGYETGARAGGWLRVAPGLHVDGNWPALGAAAGVARLLGLSVEGTMQALAIAACQLPSSLYLPIRTGRTVRNLYLAHSATLGLDSALAAQAGIDAPPDALAWYAEHLCRAATQPPPAPTADLVLDAYLKPFAAVRHVHYGAVAAQRIREQLQGQTEGIHRIVLTIYEEATVYCSNPQPATLLAAQFSLSFGVAAMLRFGALDPASYEAPRFMDAELRRLEALVQVEIDPALTRANKRGARLTVVSRRGHCEELVAADDPGLLLDAAAAIVKFTDAAAPTAAAPDAQAFCAALLQARADVPMRRLWQLLCKQQGD